MKNKVRKILMIFSCLIGLSFTLDVYKRQHFNQIAELLLIPLHGFGIGEVQHHVLVGKLSFAVRCV